MPTWGLCNFLQFGILLNSHVFLNHILTSTILRVIKIALYNSCQDYLYNDASLFNYFVRNNSFQYFYFSGISHPNLGLWVMVRRYVGYSATVEQVFSQKLGSYYKKGNTSSENNNYTAICFHDPLDASCKYRKYSFDKSYSLYTV